MEHDNLVIYFDRSILARNAAILSLIVLFVWIYPWVFHDFPFYKHSPSGLADIIWPFAALTSPLVFFYVARLLSWRYSGKPAISFDGKNLVTYRLGSVPISSIKGAVWRGGQKGWPGRVLDVQFTDGRVKSIYVDLLDAKCADSMKNLGDILSSRAAGSTR